MWKCARLALPLVVIAAVMPGLVEMPHAGASPDPSLVAYWKFDEGSGTVASDSSGNANDGVLVNGPAWVTGHTGFGLQFDGSDDYVDAGDSASLDVSEITIAMWIKPDVNDRLMNIISKWQAGQKSYVLNIGYYYGPLYPRKASFFVSTDGAGDVGLASESDVPTGTWTHVAATYGGSEMKLYMNGQLESSKAETGDIFAGTAKLFIAHADDGTNLQFDGAIDEVKIYNRALSPQEIRDEYSLVAYWKFDEGSGAVATDSSGHGYDGALMPSCPDCPQWVAGRYGNGLAFDGVNDYVEASKDAIAGLTRGTIAAWIKPNELTGDNWFFAYAMDTCLGAALDVEADGAVGYQLDTCLGSPSGSAGAVSVADWHHVAMTWDGSYVRIYVNGDLYLTASNAGYPQDYSSSIKIGVDSFLRGYGYCFNGLIDEVKIYNRALPEWEIREDYGAPVGGIAELPDVSGSSPPPYAALAGGLAAAVVALASGAWCARRRWLS